MAGMTRQGRWARCWLWVVLLLMAGGCTHEPAARRESATATRFAEAQLTAREVARDAPLAIPVPAQTPAPVDWRDAIALSFVDAVHGWALGFQTRTADVCERVL